jgi:gluconokinase
MVLVVMGPTGSGKTTIGELLARHMGWKFADADDYHSPENKEKIHRGIALTDADRAPWLAALHDQIAGWTTGHVNAVLACSALKQSYRDELGKAPDVRFIYLKGSYDLIYKRLLERKGHFADEHILASQFQALEEPADSETVTVDIGGTPEQIVEDIVARLSLTSKNSP